MKAQKKMPKGYLQASSYHIDSRLVSPGGVFFALKGNRVDGHDYLSEAKDKGAIAAVVDVDYSGPNHGLQCIQARDVAKTLQDWAAYNRELRKCKVIAITGSVGKTTTKDFAYSLIKPHFRTYKAPLNYNTQLTLPLCILNAPEDTEVLILEMGMTEKGQIQTLAKIAKPHITLITKIDAVHIENFKEGINGIIAAKGEVLQEPSIEKKIINANLQNYYPKTDLTFSISDKNAHIFTEKIKDKVIFYENGEKQVESPALFSELFFWENCTAAISLARMMGIEWKDIAPSLKNLKPQKMRFEKYLKDGITYIEDCYNASPESYRMGIESLKDMQAERKIGILGDMSTLGKYTQKYHKEVAQLSVEVFDVVFCVGQHTSTIFDAFIQRNKEAYLFSKKEPLINLLKNTLKSGDLVYVKGSRNLELEKILQLLGVRD